MRGPSSGLDTTATGITRFSRIRFTMGESSLILFACVGGDACLGKRFRPIARFYIQLSRMMNISGISQTSVPEVFSRYVFISSAI